MQQRRWERNTSWHFSVCTLDGHVNLRVADCWTKKNILWQRNDLSFLLPESYFECEGSIIPFHSFTIICNKSASRNIQAGSTLSVIACDEKFCQCGCRISQKNWLQFYFNKMKLYCCLMITKYYWLGAQLAVDWLVARHACQHLVACGISDSLAHPLYIFILLMQSVSARLRVWDLSEPTKERRAVISPRSLNWQHETKCKYFSITIISQWQNFILY